MQKDFDTWNIHKKVIQKSNAPRFIHEREIWWCSIGVNIGSEEDGKNDFFERPVLILRKFNKLLFLGIPLTSRLKNEKYYFAFYYKDKGYSLILSQLRIFGSQRLQRKIIRINNTLFKEVRKAIRELV